MSTAGDLITAAFRKIGIDSPTNAQTASALISLNNMVSGWGPEFIQPSLTRENFPITQGTASYTIGPSGAMDTVRPVKIDNAFLRDSTGFDWPVEIISGKDVNDVSLKTTEARPSALYFIPEVTQAKIIFECEPNAAYTLYIESWKPFTEFALTTTSVTLPNEYKEAIVYNLAVSLGEDWDRIVSKTVYQQAKEMKYLISAANAGTRVIPLAKFDFGGGSYNIVTDTWG